MRLPRLGAFLCNDKSVPWHVAWNRHRQQAQKKGALALCAGGTPAFGPSATLCLQLTNVSQGLGGRACTLLLAVNSEAHPLLLLALLLLHEQGHERICRNSLAQKLQKCCRQGAVQSLNAGNGPLHGVALGLGPGESRLLHCDTRPSLMMVQGPRAARFTS